LSDVQRHQERFCELYRAAGPGLAAYAGRRCHEKADADDVVSEVFLVAWRRIEDVPDGDAALPWLYGVARRVLSNGRRTQLRYLGLASKLGGLRQTHSDVEGEVVGRSSAATALAALARMKDQDQEVLRLSAWEELSNLELGAVLGCSENAATLRLHRARRRFSRELMTQARRPGHNEGEVPSQWHRAGREVL
jgi:RNA polymerase sigma-70 factor (ECF subfamily)